MNIFTAVKYCCIFHGRVFVMKSIKCKWTAGIFLSLRLLKTIWQVMFCCIDTFFSIRFTIVGVFSNIQLFSFDKAVIN